MTGNSRFRAEETTLQNLVAKTKELETREAAKDFRFTVLSTSICDLEDDRDKHNLSIKHLTIATVVLGTILGLAVIVSTILLLTGAI